MANIKTPIKDFYGKILGYVETDAEGNKVATNFYGIILGRYNVKTNFTTDFYGKFLGRGDFVVSLIYDEARK